MSPKLQNLRGVLSAAIAIAFGGAFPLALDLLKSVAGENVAIGFAVFIVALAVVFLVLLWVGRRPR
jgi:hypothetical protein